MPQVHGPRRERPGYLAPEVELLAGDVRDIGMVDRALDGVDAVYHFAAAVGVGQSMYEIAHYTTVNNLGTAVLLEALSRSPVERLIVASSMSILWRRRLCPDRSPRCGPPGRMPEQLRRGEWELKDVDGAPLLPIATPETRPPEATSVYALSKYDLYLSFTGGPTLTRIAAEFGAPLVRPLYCSVDPAHYFPEATELRYDLGYLGTYSDDRQPVLRRLLIEPARRWREGRFVVAGPQYPAEIRWPPNVQRIAHLPPAQHRRFYNAQRFTLNATRADMVRAGFAPSVRLFEAAACGTPVISDWWPGLDEFFVPEKEILVARSTAAVARWLQEIGPAERRRIGRRARSRVMAEHTAARRAEQLEEFFEEAVARRHRAARRRTSPARRPTARPRAREVAASGAGPESPCRSGTPARPCSATVTGKSARPT